MSFVKTTSVDFFPSHGSQQHHCSIIIGILGRLDRAAILMHVWVLWDHCHKNEYQTSHSTFQVFLPSSCTLNRALFTGQETLLDRFPHSWDRCCQITTHWSVVLLNPTHLSFLKSKAVEKSQTVLLLLKKRTTQLVQYVFETKSLPFLFLAWRIC